MKMGDLETKVELNSMASIAPWWWISVWNVF